MAKLKTNKKVIIISLAILLSIAGLLFVTEKTNLTNLIKKDSASEKQTESTSDEKSAKADFTADETTKQAGDTRAENKSDASVTDKKGQIGSVNSTQGIKSTSGEITVYSPSPNAEIKDSTDITGSSSLANVSYRLIDNVSGVVTTGELSVINGKFAGTLSFTSNASEARLDIYGTRPDGTEFSNVEISLRIKQ